ncbi:hypothetical protein D3C71_1426680 [compost metagenome]
MLVGQLIDIRAIGAVLAPPDAQAHDQAQARPAIEAGVAQMLAARVEHAHQRTVCDAARGGILRVHLQQRPAFGVAQLLHVDKGAVEEVARRRGNHRQRIGALRVGQLVVGQVVGQGIDAQGVEAGAVEFALARGRGETAVGKRRVGHGQVRKARGQQLIEIDLR